MRLININSPAEAIGVPVKLDDSINAVITGVLKDFHYAGMEFPVWPLVLRNRNAFFTILQVRTDSHSPAVTAAISKTWKRLNPDVPMEYYWLKERLYEQQSAGDMTSGLAFLAFMSATIAVMGLLGMVIYVTQTREKEIGIRKILGAGISVIMILLSRNFLKLLLIAAAIAIPLSYLSSYFFLNMFATRITIGPGILFSGVAGLLLVTLITVCFQVYHVAVANPVKSLRND
jgi:putative ABC transport system permease protein